MNPTIQQQLEVERTLDLTPVSARIDPNKKTLLESHAERHQTSVGGLVRIAVDRFVAELEALASKKEPPPRIEDGRREN